MLKKRILYLLYMDLDSNTSSDIKINIMGEKKLLENKQIKKNESTDTDMYLNLLANNNKKLNNTPSNSSSSLSSQSVSSKSSRSVTRKSSDTKSSSSSRSKSSTRYEKIRNPKFAPPKIKEETKKILTPQEIKMRKIELLRKLSEIKSKGYQLSKSYDFNSSIEEMEYEYELLRSFADKRNGVKLYKNILLNITSVIEFLNDRYDPFSFKLSGWSEHMSVEVDSYDDVLAELYEKYKGTGKGMPPEIKLLLLILASASAFHFSKSTFSKIPGLDGVLKSNPDLVAKMINPKKKTSRFMTEQEINLEKQNEEAIKREQDARLRRNNPQPVPVQRVPVQRVPVQRVPVQRVPVQRNSVNFNVQPSAPKMKNNHNYGNTQNAHQSVDFDKVPSIKPPEDVKSILSRLHARAADNNTSKVGNTTQEETSSNNDRILTDETLTSDTQGNKIKRKRGRKKKAIMTIL